MDDRNGFIAGSFGLRKRIDGAGAIIFLIVRQKVAPPKTGAFQIPSVVDGPRQSSTINSQCAHTGSASSDRSSLPVEAISGQPRCQPHVRREARSLPAVACRTGTQSQTSPYAGRSPCRSRCSGRGRLESAALALWHDSRLESNACPMFAFDPKRTFCPGRPPRAFLRAYGVSND